MRDDANNMVPKVEEGQEHQALKFFYTPRDEARGDEPNALAKDTTFAPDVVDALKSTFGDDVLDVQLYANEHTVYVAKERIVDVCRYLKDEHGFVYLADLGGIDRFTEDDRFEVFYGLVSFDLGKRLRVKVRVDEEDAVVPSLVDVHRAANWNERECWDMMGIRFDGHPDLRRMYMPEDFEYHPQRKEFPQIGIPGSLPLPPQEPEGALNWDPFAAAHGRRPRKSYEEPKSDLEERVS